VLAAVVTFETLEFALVPHAFTAAPVVVQRGAPRPVTG
jgi:hypothetical protein